MRGSGGREAPGGASTRSAQRRNTGPAKRRPVRRAHIDANQLEKGQYYDSMRPSYVIFICTFDPFGKSLYRYSFRNVCREDGTLELRDEAYKLFFNTKGLREGRAEGREKGLQEGRVEGRAEGRAEGRMAEKRDTACAMLKGHLTVEQVMTFTGLSREEVEKLAGETGVQE